MWYISRNKLDLGSEFPPLNSQHTELISKTKIQTHTGKGFHKQLPGFYFNSCFSQTL